jgi:ParB family chromosome partitioning protein
VAKHGGLGRGLESLLGETAGEVLTPQSDKQEIELEKIQPNPLQPRKQFDPTALQELADSIKQHGVIQPILLRKKGEKYEIVAGERRYQAACQAGLTSIPAVVREISDEDVLKIALIENLQREDLNPIETARGYQRLIEENELRQQDLAKILSRSRSSIANALRLLDLPVKVQNYLIDGSLTAGHARAILSAPESLQAGLADRIVREGLSVRQTEILASQLFVQNNEVKEMKKDKKSVPETYKAVAKQMGSSLKMPVAIKQVRGKNKVEIQFKDESELEEIVRRLNIS